MDRAEETWTASIHFHLDVNRTDRDLLLQLQKTLRQHPGTCRGFLHLKASSGAETIIALPEAERMKAGENLTREVNGLLGYDAVDTVCSPVQPSTAANPVGGDRQRGPIRNGRR
jgi:DNA polymerase-3 subunit alpha